MAGVTGLIVAIGVTADSFIVYFERIRDEVRDGPAARAPRSRPAGTARGARSWPPTASTSSRPWCSTSWPLEQRARLRLHARPDDAHRPRSSSSSSPTRSCALLARTKFFGDGHKWSGLDPRAPRRQRRRSATPAAAGSRHPAPAPRPRPCAAGTREEVPRHELSFATFGNDLYTGKRSIDFVGRQKTLVRHLRRSSSSSPLVGLVVQGLNFGHRVPRRLGVPRPERLRPPATTSRRPQRRRSPAPASSGNVDRHRHRQQHRPGADRELTDDQTDAGQRSPGQGLRRRRGRRSARSFIGPRWGAVGQPAGAARR